MKIAYQGVAGSYSESCAKKMYPESDTIPCKTFDECFERSSEDNSIKSLIPESNKTTGNIGVEYLIFKYRLNIYAEHFFPINHNLLGLKDSKIEDIKDVYSHAQALSQSSEYIKKIKLIDCSWHLPNSKRDPYKEYIDGHIPNAIFFDLDKNSDQNTDLPHMLPNKNSWEKILSSMGISKQKYLCYHSVGQRERHRWRFFSE